MIPLARDHLQSDCLSVAAAQHRASVKSRCRRSAFPVLREGNVLILANTTLEVAEACSGIRSLISLLTLGIVLGYFTDIAGVGLKTLIALSAIPVAVISNGARVAGTGISAHIWGPAAAEGFIHEFAGWLVFVAAFAMLLGLQRAILLLAPVRSPRVTAAQAAWEVRKCSPVPSPCSPASSSAPSSSRAPSGPSRSPSARRSSSSRCKSASGKGFRRHTDGAEFWPFSASTTT